MKRIFFLLIICLIFVNCKDSKNSSEEGNADTISTNESETVDFENLSTAKKLAYTNGLENWKNVNEIQFTFNVDRGGNHSERSWVWMPKTEDVVMTTAKDTVKYNRNNLTEETKKTDAAFINDKYWLLAPYNLAWDSGTTFTESKDQIAPISKEKMNKLTIVYSNEGGYTPGDAYDYYYRDDYKIKEWNYRQSNSETPSMSTTWEDFSDFNGLNIAKMHKDATGDFKLYFTGIAVK